MSSFKVTFTNQRPVVETRSPTQSPKAGGSEQRRSPRVVQEIHRMKTLYRQDIDMGLQLRIRQSQKHIAQTGFVQKHTVKALSADQAMIAAKHLVVEAVRYQQENNITTLSTEVQIRAARAGKKVVSRTHGEKVPAAATTVALLLHDFDLFAQIPDEQLLPLGRLEYIRSALRGLPLWG